MKGDIILVENYHKVAARKIVERLLDEIQSCKRRFIVSVAGESGSGKSEIGKALHDELCEEGIGSIVLGQDDYFFLPPHTNDAKRRSDPNWLGPHIEVKMDLLEKNIMDAIMGKKMITKPVTDYEHDVILEETVDLSRVRVVIVEGTYTSLLRNVDKRIFITRTHKDTLPHREKRNRGKEVGDPFVEDILEVEHKIISGHQYLADILILKDYEVVFVDTVI